jgi:hypothetical protein
VKKIIVLLLVLSVSVSLLTGCGGGNKKQASTAGSKTSIPGDVAAGGIDDMPVEEVEINYTADEAREILQAWVDSHPFNLGAAIVPDEQLMSGEKQGEDWDERMYTFYLGITRLGVAEIFVHKETGALYHYDSPYSSVGFTAIDNWYNKDHAEYAPPLSANDARTIYNTWLGKHTEMSGYTLGSHYDTYADGAHYYWFHAENPQWYWYNILVYWNSGDLLFMMTPDGEDPTPVIEPLDDYYDRYY